MRRLLPAVLGLLLLAGPAAAEPERGLAGLWSGLLRHDGQASSLALRLEESSPGAFAVRLSLSAIDVRDLPVGTATLEGDSLRLGWWTLHVDPSRRVISGELPPALVPVHRIPFVLAPADSLPPPVPPYEEAPEAEPVWSFATGGPVWAGVAAADGTVYAGSDDGVLYALDAGTGELVWRFPTSGPIRARAGVSASRVLVHSDDGVLHALDRVDGTEIWRAKLLDAPRSRIAPGEPGSRYDHYASAPVVAGDRVLVGAGDGVFALDLATGERRWRFPAPDAVSSTPAVRDGVVFVGGFDGRVRALDLATGEERWAHDTGAPVASSPAWVDGRILAGSRSYEVLALDAATGKRAWSRYVWFSWVESVVNGNGVVLAGTSDAQRLLTLDPARGALRWSVDTGGSVWAEPAVGGGAVFVGCVGVADYMVDHRGAFLAVDASRGKVLWRAPAPRPDGAKLWGFASSPAVAGDLVVAGGLDGRVVAFRASGPER